MALFTNKGYRNRLGRIMAALDNPQDFDEDFNALINDFEERESHLSAYGNVYTATVVEENGEDPAPEEVEVPEFYEWSPNTDIDGLTAAEYDAQVSALGAERDEILQQNERLRNQYSTLKQYYADVFVGNRDPDPYVENATEVYEEVGSKIDVNSLLIRKDGI